MPSTRYQIVKHAQLKNPLRSGIRHSCHVTTNTKTLRDHESVTCKIRGQNDNLRSWRNIVARARPTRGNGGAAEPPIFSFPFSSPLRRPYSRSAPKFCVAREQSRQLSRLAKRWPGYGNLLFDAERNWVESADALLQSWKP